MTPARFVFAVMLVGSALVAAYGLFLDRTGESILLTVIGLAVLGFTLGVIALRLGAAAWRNGWQGRGARSVGSALLGGICALMASGSLAGAVVLALVRPL